MLGLRGGRLILDVDSRPATASPSRGGPPPLPADLAGQCLAAPLAAEAQQAGKLPRVGFVQAELPSTAPQREAFLEGLRDRGWSDGRNVAIDWRRRDEEIPDLVRLNVDVMVLPNPYRIEAGLKQTKTIPIVTLDLESDPVGKGFLRSLSRPGGNLTGIWMDSPDIAGKQLQMLKEAVPAVRRVAVVWDERLAGLQFAATQTAARVLGIAVQSAALRHEIEADDVVKRALPARPPSDPPAHLTDRPARPGSDRATGGSAPPPDRQRVLDVSR